MTPHPSSSLLAREDAAQRARRNGISPPRVATAEHTPHADSLAAPHEVHREREDAPQPATQPPPAAPAAKTLKGAVRVGGFPERSKYPFREIANDGGVWQIDPAVYKVTAGGIVQAARKWAATHQLDVKVVTDDGMTYVQFSDPEQAAASARRAALAGAPTRRRP